MKSTIVQKYLSVLILVFFIVCQLPYASAFADTNADLNKPVSDLFNKDSETNPGVDTEIPPADLTTDKADVGSSVGDYIKTLFALLFVLGLLFGLLKLVNRKNKLYDKNRLMKNMGGISLGQQKSIQLVVIGESYYLIGVGDDIRLLKEITDPEEINKLAEFYDVDISDSATGMLNRILMKVAGKSKKSPYENSQESTDFSGIFQTKLDEMKEERKRHISRLTERGATEMNDFAQFFSDSDPSNVSTSIKMMLLLTVLSLAPAILILMTSFARIIIVLSFVRTALATQQMPPNQVLVGLALFLTFFIMAPTFQQVNDKALTPLFAEEISLDEAYDQASIPFKEFMSKHTRQKDLELFLRYNKAEKPESLEDISLTMLVPAFALSEIKTAFQMGFMIFIPFLVIDMIVASILMSMGMMMLPPVMISLPFKILLFVLVDGWYLIIKSLLQSF